MSKVLYKLSDTESNEEIQAAARKLLLAVQGINSLKCRMLRNGPRGLCTTQIFRAGIVHFLSTKF